MGRGAAVNGNGRAVLPPGSLSPVTRYRQPEHRRRTPLAVAGRIVLWLAVAAVMAGASLAGGVYLFFHESVAAVSAHTEDVKVAQERLDVALPGQPATALIVGYDRRADEAEGTASRSDTVMLVRADPVTDSISLMSFPRDLRVEIKCPDKGSYVARINEAYSYCGTQGTLETVKALTGVPINYLITINFRGFIQTVNKVGGIWMDVDRRYFNDRPGPFGYATINLNPGYQKLGGYQALDYVRYRHTDSDLYRVARQQQFVRAFRSQVRAELSATALPKLINVITKNVEVGVGGGEPLEGKTVLSYALFAYDLPPGHFFQSRIEGLEGYAELTTHTDNIQKAVQQFLNPDVESPEKATQVALGGKPKAAAPAPRETTVTVLNGNGVTGSASTAGYLLGQRGYQIIVPPNGAPANAPACTGTQTQDCGFAYFDTKIYYDDAQDGAQQAATKLSKLFGAADVETLPAEVQALRNGAMLAVVVGQTFHGNLAEAPVDQTPAKQEAAVMPGGEAALDFLRERRKRVRFPLMLPSVIERNSWIDREKPVRLYWMDDDRKHKALRLTYRTGAGEYWGVQMTDWDAAPVLGERNVTRTIKGRQYDLYYSGPKLHMVVLREGGATYWVINTLLDTLSNETMLAIAKGLKPLSQVR